jgi:NAD(P)H dehydrogenase (quinone)
MKYAVFGVTGQTGGATARALLERRHGVRAIVRRADAEPAWQAIGATTVVAEMYDAGAVAGALEGVDGAFVMLPTFFDAEDPFARCDAAIRALVTGVAESRVRNVVYLSSIGAQRDRGLGSIDQLRRLESAFATVDADSCALRAGWFMENFNGQLASAMASGTLPSMLDPLDRAVPMVAVDDIGRAAADLLTSPRDGKRAIELSYPQPFSANDVAAAMSELAGKVVTATPIPKAERAKVYAAWGLTAGAGRNMSEMIDGFNSGWIAFEGPPAVRIDASTSLLDAFRKATGLLGLRADR